MEGNFTMDTPGIGVPAQTEASPEHPGGGPAWAPERDCLGSDPPLKAGKRLPSLCFCLLSYKMGVRATTWSFWASGSFWASNVPMHLSANLGNTSPRYVLGEYQLQSLFSVTPSSLGSGRWSLVSLRLHFPHFHFFGGGVKFNLGSSSAIWHRLLVSFWGILHLLIKRGLILTKSTIIRDIKNYLNSICDLVCSLEVKDD